MYTLLNQRVGHISVHVGMHAICDSLMIFSVYVLRVCTWCVRLRKDKYFLKFFLEGKKKRKEGGHEEIQRLRNTGVDNSHNLSWSKSCVRAGKEIEAAQWSAILFQYCSWSWLWNQSAQQITGKCRISFLNLDYVIMLCNANLYVLNAKRVQICFLSSRICK